MYPRSSVDNQGPLGEKVLGVDRRGRAGGRTGGVGCVFVMVAATVLPCSACAGPRAPRSVSKGVGESVGEWEKVLAMVPADAEVVAGWDMRAFDAEVDAGAYPRIPSVVRDGSGTECEALKSSTRVAQWSGSFMTGVILAGPGAGLESTSRCALGGRLETWRVVPTSAGLVLGDASGVPRAFAPEPDLLVLVYFDDRFTSRRAEEKLALITRRRPGAGTSLLDRLEDVDLDDVTWSIERDAVEPGGHTLAHHQSAATRSFRSGMRLMGRSTIVFTTPELANLYATRLERTIELFYGWEEHNPPLSLVAVAQFVSSPASRLDTRRIRVRADQAKVVVTASLARGQRGAFERLLQVPGQTNIDADHDTVDSEIRTQIEGFFGVGHASRPRHELGG